MARQLKWRSGMKHAVRTSFMQEQTLGQRIIQAAHLAVAMHLHASVASRLTSGESIVERTTALTDRWNRSSADHG